MGLNIAVVWWCPVWLVCCERVHSAQESGLCDTSSYKCTNGWHDLSFEGRWEIHDAVQAWMGNINGSCLCLVKPNPISWYSAVQKVKHFRHVISCKGTKQWFSIGSRRWPLFAKIKFMHTHCTSWVKSSQPQELALPVPSSHMAYPLPRIL